MPLIFGEVDATEKPDLGFRPSRDQVLLHDHAGTGFPSWVGLLGGGATAHGSVAFANGGLELISPDVGTGSPNGQVAGCSALHRLTRPANASRVYIQAEWTGRVFRTASSVFQACVGFEFGLDTADWGAAAVGGIGTGGLEPTPGNRTLAMVRCTMFDEGNTIYYGGKWQIGVGSASQAHWQDLLDGAGNPISPAIAGYEQLLVGMNYGKTMRQYTELVVLLTPQTVSPAGGPITLTTTNSSTSATYTGAVDPLIGGYALGTSLTKDTFITAVNTGTKTVTLSVAASASTATSAGAAYQGVTVVGRIEGLRHNGLGFGSLYGATGYSNDPAVNTHTNDLLNQQGSNGGYASPACSRDAGFQGGMNAYVQIDNRSNQASKSKMTISRYRAVAF
jgi:hypothetical protein